FVAVFLGILALRGSDIVAQLQVVWASFFPPEPTTEQGRAIHDLYTAIFIIAAIIFLAVEGAIIWAVVRYRRKPTDTELPPQIHGNNLLEIVWTVIPMIVVAGMFFFSWQTLNSVNAADADPGEVRIRAIGARYQWTFEYLTADGSSVEFTQFAPEMVVPAGETVHLTLRSPDVIHAFYVPQFLFKRDVIPGKENAFEFDVPAEFAGQTFRGQCAELCGAQHWAMQFTVKALTPAEFDTWLADQIANAPTPAPSAEPQPSGEPQPSAEPQPSQGPSGEILEISAQNIAYDTAQLTAPADQPFTIRFANNDAGVPHNVEIRDSSGASLFMGEIFNGVDTRDYAVPALPAGTYTFICTVHPNMVGTLTVE
ncbi:MAG TPA: cytochrome c oxidase subunit II, partial [Candidatus Limnocylindrales bacterium]|nr:cytochrome c oxidase subunit II [Candidatus Limnocylindrales bacterium]